MHTNAGPYSIEHYRKDTPKLENLLANPKTIIPLINYIEATKQFEKRE